MMMLIWCAKLGVTPYFLGLIFIFLVSIIWSLASILVQYLYEDQSFDSPFLLTYLGVSLFTLLLPIDCLAEYYCSSSNKTNNNTATNNTDVNNNSSNDHHHQYHHHNRNNSTSSLTAYETLASDSPTSTTTTTTTSMKWTTSDHIWAAAKIAPVWFVSNYAYNASLRFTSITSSTVLASTGSLFTFLFALITNDEHFSWWKLCGVALGMSGSILTGLHDVNNMNENAADDDYDDSDDDAPNIPTDWRLFGDFLGLVSAVGYGLYAIMVRVLCPRDESLMSMQLFLGFVGLINMTVLSPIALYMVCTKNSVSLLVFGCLVVKGLLDNVLSDYLWARAVVLTSATVATVGLGLTIPLAFLSDVLLGNPDIMDVNSIIGAVAVLVGFVLVNVGQTKDENESNNNNVVAAADGVALVGDDDNNSHEMQITRTMTRQQHKQQPPSDSPDSPSRDALLRPPLEDQVVSHLEII